MDKLAEVNAALSSTSIIERLEFTTDLETGHCCLTLRLVDAVHRPGRRFEFVAKGVSELSVAGFGGGLTQLLRLRATDISQAQHDRTRYALRDLERGAFALKCWDISATPLPRADP